MGPIREFKRRKKAEKKVDHNVLASALSSFLPNPNFTLDWWLHFSSKIYGPLSNSKNPKTFESFFKISRKTFDYIYSLVNDTLRGKSNVTGSNGNPVSPVDQVAIALRRLTSGNSLANIGDSFGVNQSTVSRVTWRFVEAMEEKGMRHLSWPSTEAEIEVDDSNDVWIDQEKNHSMVLQAIVGPDMRFRDVAIGYPGSLSDALVLQYSDFFKLSEERKRLNGKRIELKKGKELREYIIGDEGFPLLPWLLTPFQHEVHDYQVEFNKRHSETLMVAQIALAKLKEIWRIMHGTVFLPDTNKLPRIALVCCMLHNIAIEMEDKVLDEVCISNAHDKDYQRQICDSSSQTGTDLREDVSLCLSGELVKKNKNPQSQVQYEFQVQPLLPEGVHPQHDATLAPEKVERRNKMDSPVSGLLPLVPGEKRNEGKKTLLELADELVTSCATGLSTAVHLQDKINNNSGGFAEKYFALKAEMVNKALTWKAKEELLVRAQQELLHDKRLYKEIILVKDEIIQELTQKCNLQEAQSQIGKPRIKCAALLYQKKLCIKVKDEDIQEVTPMCNLHESQSRIVDAKRNLGDKFEELLYQKRSCLQVKDENFQDVARTRNFQESRITNAEKKVGDKFEELLNQKRLSIQVKDENIQEETPGDAQKKLGDKFEELLYQKRSCVQVKDENIQEETPGDAQKKLGDKFEELLYQKRSCVQVKDENVQDVARIRNFQESRIQNVENKLGDKFELVYKKRLLQDITQAKSEEIHELTRMFNLKEFKTKGGEIELMDKIQELLDKKIWFQDIIETKDKKIEELTRLCDLQESQIKVAEKKLGELVQQEKELIGRVKEEEDLGLRRLVRYQIVLIKEMINQFADVDVGFWKNVNPPEDDEEISNLEDSGKEQAVEDVMNENKSQNMDERTEKP
ncbi:PIF / Ping-Pong family of plant transposase [Euphorbia peplus]|nr:PIF / Ping-Pong family of plant transposase [Euphorbia peplus]